MTATSSLGKKASDHLEAASPRYCVGSPLQSWASLVCPGLPFSWSGVPSAHPAPCCSPCARASRARIKTRQATGLGISHGCCSSHSPLKSSSWIPSHTPVLASAVPPWPRACTCLAVHALLKFYLLHSEQAPPHIHTYTVHYRQARVYLAFGWSNLTPPTSTSLPWVF